VHRGGGRQLHRGGGSETHHGGTRGIHRGGGFPASRQLTAAPPSSISRHPLPAVGATQRVDAGGARLSVTLRRVIDPLRDSGADLQSGTRAVGVIVQIRSAGPKVYDSSATSDVAVVVSGGAVTPVLATRGICRTPLNDFDRYITAGEDRVGCVVFAVDDGATIDAVRFSPHARAHGRLTWAP
jgi:hypothetical protein